MRKFVSAILIFALVVSFAGCGAAPESGYCKHKWKQTKTEDGFIITDRCTKCDVTRERINHDSINYKGSENGLVIRMYNTLWNDYSARKIESCDLGFAILECLSSLEETGETALALTWGDKIKYPDKTPLEGGTMWLDCGSEGLFRVSPKMTEICRVDSYFGEGKVLKMTDTLNSLLYAAWCYHPFDYWSGSYEDGKMSLRQMYKCDSVVETVRIKEVDVSEGKITLLVTANKKKTVKATAHSQQGYCVIGGSDEKTVTLKKGKETEIDLDIGGSFYGYSVDIRIDNTMISLYFKGK